MQAVTPAQLARAAPARRQAPARQGLAVCTAAGASQTSRRAKPQPLGRRQQQQQHSKQQQPGGAAAAGGGAARGQRFDVDSAPAWRLFGVNVPAGLDPGKDDFGVHPALLAAVAKKLGLRGGGEGQAPRLPADAVRVVRKAFDARKLTKAGAPAE